MADPRKAIRDILLTEGRKNPVRIELFCATDWPDAPGSRPGLFRLRVQGRWLTGAQRIAFFNADGVARLVGAFLAGHGAELLPLPPELPRGSAVRAPTGEKLAGQPLYHKTRTTTDPILGIDGRWYVAVTLFGQGTIHVPIDELGET